MRFEGDPLAFCGRNFIQGYHARLKARLSPEPDDRTAPINVSDNQLRLLPEQRVGILGAGIGGLYAALILDSLDIEYEILEASGRTGGRMCTYKFPGGGKHDYYDAGAMRFPLPQKDSQGQYKNGIMKRLAELTEYGPLNEGQSRLKDRLIPFYYHARDGSKSCFYYLNGIREPVSEAPGSFGAEGMGVDTEYIRVGVDAIVNDVTYPFVRMLARDVETGERMGWEVLMANDSYSTRGYMATKYLPSANLELPPQHLPTNVINWCRLFGVDVDFAFVETIFTLLAFTNIGGTAYGDVQWKCFKDGSETLPRKIEEYLNKKERFIRFNKRVTAIGQGHMVVETPTSLPDPKLPRMAEEPSEDLVHLDMDDYWIIDDPSGPTKRFNIPSVTITVNGNESTIDLSSAGLNAMQRNALRALQYGPATKIGIFFKSNWWTTKLGIVGGLTTTDLPISMIIYPSHGVDSSSPSRVLISYSENAYADRLGSLSGERNREVLKELLLQNLAEVHDGLHPDVTYEYLQAEFVDMHIMDWNREEFAMGAYAYFGPGEFQELYTSLTYPAAKNRLYFAGEAVSTWHGWVVGALDSSWRAVYEYLKTTGQVEKTKKFKTLWGESSEWSSTSPGPGMAEGEYGPDLLDEHLRLVDCAIRNSVISQ